MLQASSLKESSIERISVTASNYLPDQAVIMGGGLNYKIVRLDEEERREIEILREKIDISSENHAKKLKKHTISLKTFIGNCSSNFYIWLTFL